MSFKTKNSGHEAKEQTLSEKVENLAHAFSLRFKVHGQVEAWEHYLKLDCKSRKLLRNYHSSNGLVDFSGYLQRVQDSRPCGTAGKVEKLQLLTSINQELSSLPSQERTSYLNGGLLTLEV